MKLKRYGDKFGSSYVNVKVESKYADYGADYEIANYYDQSKRNFAFTKSNLSSYKSFEHKGLYKPFLERRKFRSKNHNMIFWFNIMLENAVKTI